MTKTRTHKAISVATNCALLIASVFALDLVVSPSPASANPALCQRLEVQLANLAQPRVTNPREARRYDRAIREQQQQLNRVNREARRNNCTGRLFEGRQCRQLSRMKRDIQNRVQQLQGARNSLTQMVEDPAMRARITSQMQRLNCGVQNPSYAAYGQDGTQPQRRRGFFNWLFGGNGRNSQFDDYQTVAYRTVCVRHYDGFFVPISFATVPEFFANDAGKCGRIWPGHESGLFVFTIPDQTLEDAVSITGQTAYRSLPNAFRFQREFVDPDKAQNTVGLNVTSVTIGNSGERTRFAEAIEQAESENETHVAALVGAAASGNVLSDALPSNPGVDEALQRPTLQDIFIHERNQGGGAMPKARTTVAFVPLSAHQDAVMGSEVPQALPGNEDLPLAQGGFRDVYDQPFVSIADTLTSVSYQKNRYPPLPPRRPDTPEPS